MQPVCPPNAPSIPSRDGPGGKVSASRRDSLVGLTLDGDSPDLALMSEILRFQVVPLGGADASSLPTALNVLSTRIATAASVTRHMVLAEIEDPVTGNPVVGLLNNTGWEQPVTEAPKLGATEIWQIVTTTGDSHPIHIHLVQFNLLNCMRRPHPLSDSSLG